MSSATKRELFVHYAYWFSFFILLSVIDNSLRFDFWPFWLGGILGTILPDFDHLIYILFTRPHELTSQRVVSLINKKEAWGAVQLLYDTREERKDLVFHTIFFQLILFVLTFLVVSSSGSLFGMGLVLAFALHLNVDQLIDLEKVGSLSNWYRLLPYKLTTEQSKVYWLFGFLATLVLGLAA